MKKKIVIAVLITAALGGAWMGVTNPSTPTQNFPVYGHLTIDSWPIEVQRELNTRMQAGEEGVCLQGIIDKQGVILFKMKSAPDGPKVCPANTVGIVYFVPSPPPNRAFVEGFLAKVIAASWAARFAHVSMFWPPAGDGKLPCWCGPPGHGMERDRPVTGGDLRNA